MKKKFSSAKEIFHYIIASLDHYDSAEAKSIAYILLEYFGISRTDVLSGKQETFENGERLHEIIDRLNNWEPIQYILGETYFYGRRFSVSSSVLIPRQETEELIKIICDENRGKNNLCILDIGTGSGCIAISVEKEISNCQVYALDTSDEALDVARNNAAQLKSPIHFIHADIFTEAGNDLPMFDIIISNPPYVKESEKKFMSKNVLDFEPSLALFVKDHEPLVYYSRIVEFAQKKLVRHGKCYFEINEVFGAEIQQLMINAGFTDVKIYQDLNNKSRFVAGCKAF